MTDTIYPLVTIGIPTYNRADGYLREALASAVGQTYPNLEIVVSDNGSTDNTEAVVKGMGDSRIRYFRQDPSLTPNDNFNYCLEQAQGDYFLLLHDDDIVDSDFVEICMRAANYETHFGLLRTGTRIISGDGTVLREASNRVSGVSPLEFFLGWFTGKTELYLCSTMFNTKRLKELGGFQSKHDLFQDVVAEVQLAARFGRVDVRDVKASFRQHGTSRTAAGQVINWCEDSLLLLDMICDLVQEKRDMVRSEGLRFFTMINYNRTGTIRAPLRRFAMYWVVFKVFDYRYSPIHFFIDRYILPPVERVKDYVKGKARQALICSRIMS